MPDYRYTITRLETSAVSEGTDEIFLHMATADGKVGITLSHETAPLVGSPFDSQ